MKLTDSGDGATCMTAYSNAPAFNSDNTKVAAYCETRLKMWDFNPVTMQRSESTDPSEPPE